MAPNSEDNRLRGVERHTRAPRNLNTESPSIIAQVRLPDWQQSASMAWPPPEVPISVQVVSAVGFASHPGGEWWKDNEARKAHAGREKREQRRQREAS